MPTRNMHMVQNVILFGFVSLSVACAGTTEDTRLTNQSQVQLTSPPTDFCDWGKIGAWNWIVGDGPDLRVSLVGDPGTLTPTNQVMALTAYPWVDDSGDSFLLVGAIDANDKFSLFRFHDGVLGRG